MKFKQVARTGWRFVIAILFFLAPVGLRGQDRFSKAQVLEDLAYLKASLEAAHYDLYAYTPKGTFDRNYRAVRRSVKKDSLTRLEVISLFQRVVSKADIGHTSIDFPGADYARFARAGGKVFPLEIAFEDGKALVRKNWSDNPGIETGAEVLRINGLSMAKLLKGIYPQIAAERPYFKRAKIELYSFPRLYWQVYGARDAFEVAIRSNGQVTNYELPAIDVIQGYEMKRNEVFNATMQLRFTGLVAVLNPGNFSGDEPRYQQFIDSAFASIARQGSRYLVLDLRNNAGGNDSFSDYLVGYLADQPFRWNARFSLKTSRLLKDHTRQHSDTTTAFSQSILSHEDGETYPFDFGMKTPQPQNRRFTGRVYVLVNRQSHSQAAVTAAQIQDYGFGTIVGEETGEYPTLYASQFPITLPRTGIPVNISKGYIVRVNGSEDQKGVIPDIIIKDHLLDEKDEILDGLLKLLPEDDN